MSEVSVEGLRQAFLDPGSRIRLNSDDPPDPHTELIAAFWQGGLLDGQSVRFNESLNVLIGGRGAGKSTLIESLRFAFDLPPKGDDARRLHDNMIKNLLGHGASISVLVRSPHPSPQYYLVQRNYAAKPRVRDHNGDLLDGIAPSAILGNIEVYGQHEISELTRHPAKLAELLRRFTIPVAGGLADKEALTHSLAQSRSLIISEGEEIGRVEEALAALPTLREQLRRFSVAGLDEKLKEKTLVDAERRVFSKANALVEEAHEHAATIRAWGTADSPILIGEEADLPNAVILSKLNDIQLTLAARLTRAARYVGFAAESAEAALQDVMSRWQPQRDSAEQNYERILRELRAGGHNGSEYVSVKDQVERLRPKEAERGARMERLSILQSDRSELLARWEDAKAADFRALKQAARGVSRRLRDRVRVGVRRSRQLGQLESILRNHVVGNINQAVERLRTNAELNVSNLADTIRAGAGGLIVEYGFSQAAAEKIAQAGNALALEVEECEIPAEAVLELNVGLEQAPVWKELVELSTGQKATAVLLLLLLESSAPLIVDQPEDDLDNRFIADSVVPAMRQEKRRRQFIFSSHNANIPVLGDAEQIVGLTPIVDEGSTAVTISPELCGSIDVAKVKDLVKELLEGGQAAFEYRREKYGF